MCALKSFLGDEMKKCNIDSINWVNVNNAIDSFEQQTRKRIELEENVPFVFYILLNKNREAVFVYSFVQRRARNVCVVHIKNRTEHWPRLRMIIACLPNLWAIWAIHLCAMRMINSNFRYRRSFICVRWSLFWNFSWVSGVAAWINANLIMNFSTHQTAIVTQLDTLNWIQFGHWFGAYRNIYRATIVFWSTDANLRTPKPVRWHSSRRWHFPHEY